MRCDHTTDMKRQEAVERVRAHIEATVSEIWNRDRDEFLATFVQNEKTGTVLYERLCETNKELKQIPYNQFYTVSSISAFIIFAMLFDYTE